MSYQVTSTNYYLIDGSETNVAERALVRDYRVFLLDGISADVLASSVLLKETRSFIVDGGVTRGDALRLADINYFVIEGGNSPDRVNVSPSLFEVLGRPVDREAVKSTSQFVLEIVDQETPP